MPMPTVVNGKPVRTGAWTPEEDALLAEWQGKYGNRWSSVAKKITGRTGQQCAQRWRHKVNPNIRKEKWTPQEDAKLIALYRQYGNAWAEIARFLEGRTDQQCMGRWRRHLDPAIKRSDWEPREDTMLVEQYAVHGSQWARISHVLPGRTAQQCRARWFQLEAGADSLPRSGARTAAAAKRLQYDSDACYDADEAVLDEEYDELAEDCDAGSTPRGRGSCAGDAARAGSGSDEEGAATPSEEDSPPPDFSTPLRRAYSRAMSGYSSGRTGISSSCRTVAQLERRASSGAITSPNVDDLSAAALLVSQSEPTLATSAEPAAPARSEAVAPSQAGSMPPPPARRPGAGTPVRRPRRAPGASPLGRAPPSRQGTAAADGQHAANGQRTLHAPLFMPSCTLQRPDATTSHSPSRQLTTPQRRAAAPGGATARATPVTPRTLARTPGDGPWRQSPAVSILSLLHSPSVDAQASRDMLQSPGFGRGLMTPDWAKRKTPDARSAPAQACSQGDGEPAYGRPHGRAGVARRLNIDPGTQQDSAAAAPESSRPGPGEERETTAAPAWAPHMLGSPAKKLKVDSPLSRRVHPASPAAVLRLQYASGSPSLCRATPGEPRDTPGKSDLTSEYMTSTATGMVESDAEGSVLQAQSRYRLTDKENSACNALKQLSILASAELGLVDLHACYPSLAGALTAKQAHAGTASASGRTRRKSDWVIKANAPMTAAAAACADGGWRAAAAAADSSCRAVLAGSGQQGSAAALEGTGAAKVANQEGPDALPAPGSSSQVRMRLHALLEGL